MTLHSFLGLYEAFTIMSLSWLMPLSVAFDSACSN